MTDWFQENAPATARPATQPQESADHDWFAQNAPRASSVPGAEKTGLPGAPKAPTGCR